MAENKGAILYSKAIFILLCSTLGVRVASLYIMCSYAVPGNRNIMVATVPVGMELTVLAWILGIALFVCVGCYIWRYAEHNEKTGEDRKSNKILCPKFLGALLLAIVASTYFSYFLAAPAVEFLNVAEPVLADFITVGGLLAIFGALGFTILFTEGVTGLSKFVSQGVKSVQDAADDLLAELAAAKAELAKLKKEEEDDVIAPKQ